MQKASPKNLLDKTIEDVLRSNNPLSEINLNRVSIVAQVQDRLEAYRNKSNRMSESELRAEEHSSAKLGQHLEWDGKTRPSRCHAHALVAGRHKYAAQLRIIMAVLKIRIDDPDNGCWLPENTAATPHPAFPSAPPHSRIHRYNYFFWLFSRLSRVRNEPNFRTSLQIIGKLLQNGEIPDYVMLPKLVGVPSNRRL